MKRYKMDNAWVVPKAFATALDLSSASCDNNTLKSIGMFGIVIDNRDVCRVYSCDNVTVSVAQIKRGRNRAVRRNYDASAGRSKAPRHDLRPCHKG